MNAAWHFAKHRVGQPFVNPLGSEHFSEAEDDWRAGEVLVRECIQNSLDAGVGNEPVCVRFQISGSVAMPKQTAEHWFSSLWPHLRSPDCKLADVSDQPSEGGFVVVEDFGTKGLEGDVRQGSLSDVGNRFFSFFRAEGLSGNSMNGTSGGSWGVGKSVFNRCSGINSVLALTVRRSDGSIALIGKSLLRQHVVPEGEFQGIGQFGTKDSQNEFLVLPENDQGVARRFVHDFGLVRHVEGDEVEPGLSVVIPYANREISADGIAEIVIREYFHPIISGHLRVQVSDSDIVAGQQKTIELNRDTIFRCASELRRPEVARVLELARWSMSAESAIPYALGAAPAGGPPVWGDDMLRREDPEFGALCGRFERGERVAIRVSLYVQRRRDAGQPSSFDVFLQRDTVGSGYRPVFVRGSIVVPNARQRAVRNQSLFSLVTIGEGPLAVMLRAAEPPAHTFWSPDTANFRGHYEFGKQTIDFVVAAPKYLADALSSARTERDVDVWADLFPSPITDGERDAQGDKRKGNRRNRPPIEPPPRRSRAFRVDEAAGGFAITRDHADSSELPSEIEVLAAYDTSRGNPFERYNSADFDMSKLTVQLVGAEAFARVDNRLAIRLLSEEFRVEVTGFDTNRDVVVRTRATASQKGDQE